MVNPLFQAAVSSYRFAKRRRNAALPELETLIIDVDRTITKEDSPKLALERLAGKAVAERVFESFPRRVIRGELKLQDIHAAVYGELYSRGFRRSDWISVMEELERTGGLKRRTIDALIELSRRESLTLVLATRASRDSAEWLARRYGFHHAVGSVEHVNGTFQGFETMIGSEDNGNGTMTKLTAASKAMAASGKTLDPKRTAVIANDLLDALEMLNCARGVIIMNSSPNTLESITSKLRLYDAMVSEENAHAELPAALGF
ncbi:MAG TPA: HAD family hydrolase [Candidatus Bilamarchaeum sp.]|nr:HAD family hydrolase [Candidatus Bilamarchaeum sp.]